MAAEIERETGERAQLVVGKSGELSIWLDDQLVAEKKLGRFPEPVEVVAALKALTQQRA